VISLVREKDIAVLKLELTPEQQAALKPVTLGSSSNLLVSGGQVVVCSLHLASWEWGGLHLFGGMHMS
jgi:hypothetical protein